MKAKDYFDKFIGPIKECENDNQKLMAVTNAIYVNFQYELNQIVEQRKIKFLNAAISVIDEQNRKWNACTLGRVRRCRGTPSRRCAGGCAESSLCEGSFRCRRH